VTTPDPADPPREGPLHPTTPPTAATPPGGAAAPPTPAADGAATAHGNAAPLDAAVAGAAAADGAAAPPTAAADGAAAAGAGADGEDAAGDGDAGEWEARRGRAMRAARGALAGALMLEAIAVLFVPRAIAPLDDGPGLTGGRLAVLLTLAVLLLVASGLQRRRAGLVLGSVLQVAVIATGVLLTAMYVLGLIFAAAWLYLLKVRQDLTRATAPPPTT
jgi:Protein of unknown function (DUF4233)